MTASERGGNPLTLNICVVGNGYLLQASDRMISIDGEPKDELNKAVVFVSGKLKVGMTYTGLATTPDGFPMDIWVAEQVPADEFPHADLDLVAKSIAASATGLFSGLLASWRTTPTIFTLTGWETNRSGPTGRLVHNCLDDHGRRTTGTPTFRIRRMNLNEVFHTAGVDDTVTRQDRRSFERLVSRGRQAERIKQEMVTLMRRVANARPKVVSPNCLVLYLPKAGNGASTYFPREGDPTTYGPTIRRHDPASGGGFTIGAPVIQYGDQIDLTPPPLWKKIQ